MAHVFYLTAGVLHSAVTGELPCSYDVFGIRSQRSAFRGTGHLSSHLRFFECVARHLAMSCCLFYLFVASLLSLHFPPDIFAFCPAFTSPSISAASLVLCWSCTLGDDGPRVIWNDHDVAWWRLIHGIRTLRDEDS